MSVNCTSNHKLYTQTIAGAAPPRECKPQETNTNRASRGSQATKTQKNESIGPSRERHHGGSSPTGSLSHTGLGFTFFSGPTNECIEWTLLLAFIGLRQTIACWRQAGILFETGEKRDCTASCLCSFRYLPFHQPMRRQSIHGITRSRHAYRVFHTNRRVWGNQLRRGGMQQQSHANRVRTTLRKSQDWTWA